METDLRKYKISIVTAARSEYGLLQWLISDLESDPETNFSLIVTGSHLSPEQGLTYKLIEKDNHNITKKIEFLISSETQVGIAKSAALSGLLFVDALSELKPDILILLGDRYELLPIATSSLLLNIPIAHISGGDITEGAIDNEIRNAITMMSSLHFPGTEESAFNIKQMRNWNKYIYNVGEPGLETFIRAKLFNRKELSLSLDLDIEKNWILVTLHPETKKKINFNLSTTKTLMDALLKLKDYEIVITASNVDYGGTQMNSIFQQGSKQYSHIHYIYSLGQLTYLSMMKESQMMVGNTSSGIVEAPFLGTPVINIGERQKGRYLCENIINVNNDQIKDLYQIIKEVPNKKFPPNFYFGDGNTSAKIIKHIKDFLDGK